ncbi:hypothetical protein, partial [Flavobacterium sp. 270]|uniref:hypothetical protein n=1 Tax=Flavobacterium sp. 270 TaxID=2512114 RepID=UPI00141706E9
MKRPTILRTLIFALAMLLNFVSYSQNLIAFDSKSDKSLEENLFFKTNNQFNNLLNSPISEEKEVDNFAVPIIPNPVLKYAQAPYSGTVSICPNDGKELPKLFICGSNDARLIETGITNALASNIVWSKLGGTCTAFANVNCASETAANSCWTQVATGPNYSASVAGEYRLKITYPDATVFTFYFNVYTNDLDPTNIKKSNIVTGTSCTGSGTSSIPGKIIVGGFGSGYEYAIAPTSTTATPTATPTTGWQDSNIFANITAANNYDVFIRLKNVPSSCVFRVRKNAITSNPLSISTTITQPKCFGGTGGTIKINTGDIGLKYYFRIFKNNVLVSTIGPTAAPEFPFDNLAPGNDYKAQVSVDGNPCVSNTTGNLTINNAPQALTATLTTSATGNACSTDNIKINASQGTSPYKYFVSINGSAYVANSSDVVVVTTTGTYSVRVEDLNGCTTTVSTNRTSIAKPNYVITPSNPNCNSATGKINVKINNTNSYTVQYRLDSDSYISGSTGSSYDYSGLGPGTYTIRVRYRLSSNNNWCNDDVVVTILDAPNALTASAGVAALAGCAGDNGIVRITNPSGGTPPYTYSFDGGNTYIATNEAALPPSASPGYTLYIKDSSLPTPCIYSMPGIIIDPKPANPVITYSAITYDCDGLATISASVTSPGGLNYEYSYLIDGVVNTNEPPNVFPNIAAGDHEIKVQYNLVKVSTQSNLLTENFGRGNPTTSPGINPAYCFENMSGTHPPGYACNTDNNINDGEYAVVNRITYRFGSWLDFRDHTSAAGPVDSQGRFLAINIGGVAGIGGIIYRKPIYDVIPNQDVKISFWVGNLIENTPGNAANDDPNITIQLIADYGLPSQTLVASQETGVVPKSNKWENYNMSLNPGSYTTLDFVIRSYSAVDFGNDLVLDDVVVFQTPRTCVSTDPFKFTVQDEKGFIAEIAGFTNEKCKGQGNGTITLKVRNFGTEYEYSLSGGAAGSWVTSSNPDLTITNLQAKTYDIRIRRKTGEACTKTLSPVIGSPAEFIVEAVATPGDCVTPTSIKATATGGNTPYTLILTNDANGAVRTFPANGILTNVAAGTYTVSGSDINSCSDSNDSKITVADPTGPTAEVDKTTGLCFGGTSATINVNVSGGVAPYRYQVSLNSGAYNTTPISFTGNTLSYTATATGTYNFIIWDNNSCKASAISQKIDGQISATTAVKTALSCKTVKDATIEVTINGGTAPFTYTVKNKTTGQLLFTSGSIATTVFSYSTADAGTYTFDIKDSNGCTATKDGTVNSLTAVIANASPSNPKCNGAATGSVTLSGSGGVGPYTYNFNGLGFSTTTVYSNLTAGTAYSYQVKDSNDCVSTIGSITLSQPAVITASTQVTPYLCGQTGSIKVISAAGGTAGYMYSINGVDFQAGDTFTGLTNGTYTITVRDINMCTGTTAPVTLDPLTPPTALSFSPSALSCPTLKVSITVTSTGGSGAKTYSIVSPAAYTSNVSGLTSGIFTNLDPGIVYRFEVKDAKNCTFQDNYTVANLPALTVSKSFTNVLCSGTSTGTATFTVTGSTGFSYTLNGVSKGAGTSPISLTNLAAGTYAVVVTNTATSCSASASVTIASPASPLTLTAAPSPITCDAPGSVVLTANGGWGGNSYRIIQPSPGVILGPQASATFTGLALAGTYTAEVTDSNGCIVTKTFTLSTPAAPTASVTGSDICYDTTNQATIKVTGTGGVAPYEYSINNGTSYQSGDTFSNLLPGTYTVIVKDAYGCKSTAVSQIIADQLLVSIVLNKDIDCKTPSAARITGTIQGGTGPYTYGVSTNGGTSYTSLGAVTGTSFTYDTSTAGTYQFQVFDVNSCPAVSGTRDVHALIPVIANASPSNPKCNGAATGSVTLSGSGGVGPYT